MVRDYKNYHTPILGEEVLSGLNVKANGKYIDATVGGGGHTIGILKKGGNVLCLDKDPDAITFTRKRLEKEYKEGKDFILRLENFANLKKIAQELQYTDVDGILFDLGISGHQLDESGRGFTFKKDEPLDMRMDSKGALTAQYILNHYTKGELYDIFSKFAEEINSRNVSEAIIRARSIKSIDSTKDLLDALRINLSNKEDYRTVTRIFQALRIEVNDELGNIKKAIPQGIDLLKTGGRLVFLSFHSLEDRMIKLNMKKERFISLTKKPIVAGASELERNPRAKSAKLRIYEKI